MTELPSWSHTPVAVLVSGGPDSAILVGELARTSPRVVPVYVRIGMIWEDAEEAALRRYLIALGAAPVEPLRVFEMPVRNVYGDHWSTTGQGVPDAKSPDSAVFLPGRNLIIVLQAALWCHLNDVPTLALGLLAGNPFPDSTDTFFTSYQAALNAAVGGRLNLVRPYRTLSKIDVLRRGIGMPLGETWSCLRPIGGRQCGVCNKCAERRKAFSQAGVVDTTLYAT